VTLIFDVSSVCCAFSFWCVQAAEF